MGDGEKGIPNAYAWEIFSVNKELAYSRYSTYTICGALFWSVEYTLVMWQSWRRNQLLSLAREFNWSDFQLHIIYLKSVIPRWEVFHHWLSFLYHKKRGTLKGSIKINHFFRMEIFDSGSCNWFLIGWF